jgi:hypothetical protein
VVSGDREVLRAAARAGAVTVTADAFLACLESRETVPGSRGDDEGDGPDRDESDRDASRRKKGNPRRLGKKARVAARALRRIGPGLSR